MTEDETLERKQMDAHISVGRKCRVASSCSLYNRMASPRAGPQPAQGPLRGAEEGGAWREAGPLRLKTSLSHPHREHL